MRWLDRDVQRNGMLRSFRWDGLSGRQEVRTTSFLISLKMAAGAMSTIHQIRVPETHPLTD